MLWNQRQHDTAMISELRDDVSRRVASEPSVSSATTLGSGATSDEQLRLRSHLGHQDSRNFDDADLDCRQVVSTARFMVTNTIRDILGRQTDFEPWSIADVQRFQTNIERMTVQVKGRIDKLQVLDGHEIQDAVSSPNYETIDGIKAMRQASIQSWGLQPTTENRIFLAWSRKLLNILIEKAVRKANCRNVPRH